MLQFVDDASVSCNRERDMLCDGNVRRGYISRCER